MEYPGRNTSGIPCSSIGTRTELVPAMIFIPSCAMLTAVMEASCSKDQATVEWLPGSEGWCNIHAWGFMPTACPV